MIDWFGNELKDFNAVVVIRAAFFEFIADCSIEFQFSLQMQFSF